MSRQRALSGLITKHGWKKGVELGVANGATLFSLLKNHPDLYLIGVDSYERCQGKGDKKTTGFKSYDWAQQKVLMNLVAGRIASEFMDRSYLIVLPTTNAAEEIKDNSLDFVFIDADHRESFARADSAAWVPKLKKSGYLLGHDWKFKSVQKALDGMLPGWKTLESIWFIPKERICFR